MLPPRPPAIMCGAAARVPWKTEARLSFRIASQPFSLVSRNGARNVPPTLFTSTSTRPKRAAVASTAWATAWPSRTSVGSASASPPADAMSATVFRAVSSERSTHRDARAERRERERDAAADARTRAGDDRGAPGEEDPVGPHGVVRRRACSGRAPARRVSKPFRNPSSCFFQPSGYFFANVSMSFFSSAGSRTSSPRAVKLGPSGFPTAIFAFGRPALMRFTRQEVGRVPTYTLPSSYMNQISAGFPSSPVFRSLCM